MTETYKIVRFYEDPDISARTIKRGLTLEQAQAHCQNPETSSITATGAAAARVTRRVMCRWFDGYRLDR